MAAQMKSEAKRPNGLFILDRASVDLIYGEEQQRQIEELCNIYAPPQDRDSIKMNRELLANVDVIFSGWGAPRMDETFLNAAPNLRIVFYGAGSVRPITSEAFWNREIAITSAYAANAVPVAEYTISTILLSLKQFWRYSALAKEGKGWGDHTRPALGSYDSTVGIISCGAIARKTLELLRPFDLKKIIYCPFLSAEEAAMLNVERVTLEELFKRADVISLHTPLLTETRGMITGRHFESMKQDATFINTSRGPIVREKEMCGVLERRPDLTAILDVWESDPEPLKADSPLLLLRNVVLTPHIAGSMGREIHRLGRCMVDELKRYLAGEPLIWQLTKEAATKMA
jgi:phosphoglycerate dehydrogenase-like enzyme